MKVAKRKVYMGWNVNGKFECECGDGVRLNDLAMFSIYLQQMALADHTDEPQENTNNNKAVMNRESRTREPEDAK